MSPSEPATPRPARPLDAGERGELRRLQRDLELHDPGFAVLLRAIHDGVAHPSAGDLDGAFAVPTPVPGLDDGSPASPTLRAWIWILAVLGAIMVGLIGVALVAATVGLAGLAVGGAALLTLFIGMVVGIRLA